MKETTTAQSQDIFLVFRDMLLYVLLRWRRILVAALVLAVLVCGVTYWGDYSDYRERTAAAAGTSQSTLPELTAEELAQVVAAQKYRSNYEGLCAYNTASQLMKIDAEAVPTHRLTYLLQGDLAYGAALLYQQHLEDEALYASLVTPTEQNDQPQPAYLAELVTATVEQDEAMADGADGYALLQVRVVAPTEELCQQLAALVKESLNAKKNALGGDMAVKFDLVTDRYAVLRIPSIRDQQQNSLTAQANLATKLEEAEDELSSTQQAYIDRQAATNPSQSTPQKPGVSRKMLVLGFLLGGVLAVLWYVVQYIFSHRVQSRTDMTLRYALPVFGTVKAAGKKGFFLDRWFKQWLQDKPDTPALVWRQVTVAAAREACQNLYVTGDVLTADEALLQGLKDALAAKGVTVTVGAYPLTDDGAMDALTVADRMLLVETVGASSHKELARALTVANQCGCPVLGAVLVQ